MGVDLTLKALCRQIAGPNLAAQIHCFSYGNPHILALLMGVDLTLRTLCRQIAGPHLAAQIHCFSYGNLHILALLMGVDLTLKTLCRQIAGPHLASQRLKKSKIFNFRGFRPAGRNDDPP